MSDETTLLREKLNKLIIEIERLDIKLDSPAYDMTLGEYEQEREKLLDEFEQAIAATLGKPKAKSHPYGYERDTGAYDATRCECGCINDISATYCNDCGGEIEIDESAEKEYYDGYSKHTVFAKKHDDGSLEFCERRYVPEDAATLGSDAKLCYATDYTHGRCKYSVNRGWTEDTKFYVPTLRHGTLTAEQVHDAIFNGSTYASYDGVKYYADGIHMQEIADELNAAMGAETCKPEKECLDSYGDLTVTVCSNCRVAIDDLEDCYYCPNCGAKVVE